MLLWCGGASILNTMKGTHKEHSELDATFRDMHVLFCVCVCETDREREREREGIHPLLREPDILYLSISYLIILDVFSPAFAWTFRTLPILHFGCFVPDELDFTITL